MTPLTRAAVLMMMLGSPALADWPQWRGPLGTGVADGDAPTVATFAPDTGENVRWVVPMPGPSAGTPAIVGPRVFLSSYDPDTGRVEAIALDASTGDKLWQHNLGRGRDSNSRGRENFLAEGSPAADADRVVFLTGAGDLACFTHDGEAKWSKNLVELWGEMQIVFGHAGSPLLHDGKVYVSVLRRNEPAYLAAFDADTGELIFKHDRPTAARAESREAYTTPLAANIGGKTHVLVYGGDALTGHEPDTGDELWRFTDELNPNDAGNFRAVAGPVQGGDGVVYVLTPRGSTLLALEFPDGKPALKWAFDDANSDVATPAWHDHHLYLLGGERKHISKLRTDETDVVWTQRLDANSYFRASPTVADGKLYLLSAEGELFILSAGDTFEQLLKLELEGYPARASIAAAHGAIYIRTADRLICAAAE